MTRKHATTTTSAARWTTGFTLIELMITLVVLAILAVIAVPIYEHQVEASRRTEARTALLELAEREERYYATNNAYTSDPTDLGYNAASWPVIIGGGYYEIEAPQITDVPSQPPYFLLTAVAIGNQAQNDTDCETFTVDSMGVDASLNNANQNSTAECW